MAWSQPRTWTVGDAMFTAAAFNAELRDNFNFLFNPPGAITTRNAAQSLGTGGETQISFDTGIFQTNGATHSASGITLTIDGIYLLGFTRCGFSTSDVGYRYYRLGGVIFVCIDQVANPDASNDLALDASSIQPVEAGATITLHAAHAAGVGINTGALPRLYAAWRGGG